MADVQSSPAVPSSEYNGHVQSLLESAGQGRLDSIVRLMDQAPNILESKGKFGESVGGVTGRGSWLLASPAPLTRSLPLPPGPEVAPAFLKGDISARERADARRETPL